MSKVSTCWLSVLALLVIGAGSQLGAQPLPPNYSPYSRTQLSPYLNLLRNNNIGGFPAVNYYLGTLPERQRRQQFSQLRTGVIQLDQRYNQQQRALDTLGQPLEVTPLSGGHPTYFLNTGNYFNLPRPGAPTSGGPGLQQPRR